MPPEEENKSGASSRQPRSVRTPQQMETPQFGGKIGAKKESSTPQSRAIPPYLQKK